MTSPLKVLVDAGVGTSVERWLRETGYDVLTVRDLDPHMRDTAVLALAERERRLLITMDKDFGELAFRSGKAHAGVLLLRLEDARAAEKAAVVREILSRHGVALAGRFAVYQRNRLRIRGG